MDNVAVVEEHVNFGPEEFVIMAKHVSKEPVLHESLSLVVMQKEVISNSNSLKFLKEQKVIDGFEIKIWKNKNLKLFGKDKYKEDYEEILMILQNVLKTSLFCFFLSLKSLSSFSPSILPFSNSPFALPKVFASSGIFFAPKMNTTAMIIMKIHS